MQVTVQKVKYSELNVDSSVVIIIPT